MRDAANRHEAPARDRVGTWVGSNSFERLTLSTGKPEDRVQVLVKVALSDAEEVNAISFRPLLLSAQRPGNVQRPSPLRRATQDQRTHSQPQKVPLPVYVLSTTHRANFTYHFMPSLSRPIDIRHRLPAL